MASIQNGPLPSRLILLADLPTLPAAQKVRFLGCVTSYSTKKASMTLEHNHPAGNKLRALVNIELLLNTLKSTQTSIGEWVNVIGYTKASATSGVSASARSGPVVEVEALVLWSAGPLKLDGYEQSLDKLKDDNDDAK
ncbi:CST complex subunit Ten1 [Calycina marina]|uniref:CST complex subunit Ten1 n=1 Tax=Calycina marina TaxID=1763456 RepID=A0A9P7YZ96_9HELO|nr:CST complex subunit Ten1 [Calycina marina]